MSSCSGILFRICDIKLWSPAWIKIVIWVRKSMWSRRIWGYENLCPGCTERNKKHENLIGILVTVRVLGVKSNFFELNIGFQEEALFSCIETVGGILRGTWFLKDYVCHIFGIFEALPLNVIVLPFVISVFLVIFRLLFLVICWE